MIDCKKITEIAKDAMFSAIEKTEEEIKEHFIKLCEDKNKNIIPSNVCVGIYCMVPRSKILEAKCPDNTTEIGNFHTHPISVSGPARPSGPDIVAAAVGGYQIFCIGHSKSLPTLIRENKWIERKKHVIDCYDIKDKQLLELGNKAHKAALTRDTKLFDELVNEMSSRLDPSKIKSVLNKKCTMSETKELVKKIIK